LTDEGENHNVIPEDLTNYKVARSGNLVINKMKAWQGSMGIAPCDGVVSPAYFVFDFRIACRAFGQMLLRCRPYVAHFAQASDGVRLGQWDLSVPGMRQIPVLIPAEDDQEAIVRFLDHANGQVERAIRAKKKLIALLNEQKQAIIHRAVTRGLDLTVPLKPSGIPWLGDIPKHWETQRNCWLFEERIEKGRAGLPLLVVSLRTGVTEGSDVDEDGRPKRLIADMTAYKYAAAGDIAYNMMRMWQGAVGVVPRDGLVSPAYVVAKPKTGVFSGYFELLFRTDGCKNEVNRNSRGIVSDRNRLYWDQFKRLYLPLPPIEEQKDIVSHVNAQTQSLNAAIANAEREIDLLREYRIRLTADVVTGKLDVREAAKSLPVESETPATAPTEEAVEESEVEET
jgi:type I restriction enzyme S subunit